MLVIFLLKRPATRTIKRRKLLITIFQIITYSFQFDSFLSSILWVTTKNREQLEIVIIKVELFFFLSLLRLCFYYEENLHLIFLVSALAWKSRYHSMKLHYFIIIVYFHSLTKVMALHLFVLAPFPLSSWNRETS